MIDSSSSVDSFLRGGLGGGVFHRDTRSHSTDLRRVGEITARCTVCAPADREGDEGGVRGRWVTQAHTRTHTHTHTCASPCTSGIGLFQYSIMEAEYFT